VTDAGWPEMNTEFFALAFLSALNPKLLAWRGQSGGQCQEYVMTAELPDSPVTEAVCSLEVRWIFPGQLETAVAGWFGRFPADTESRDDIYLLDPQVRGLSVKVRGGAALEVKVYRGSPGILEVAGRARGRMQSWQKWSFPFSPLRQDSSAPVGWTPVRKRRRISRFSLVCTVIQDEHEGVIRSGHVRV
jgi:hypothetical protein